MPLLKRTPFEPDTSVPKGLAPGDECFVVRVTGEVFRTYAEYTAAVRLYRRRDWTCRFTGKTGLTYEEAKLSEEAHAGAAAQLPRRVEEDAVRMLHHSTMRIEDVVRELHNLVATTYDPGDLVSASAGVSWLRGAPDAESAAFQGRVVREVPVSGLSDDPLVNAATSSGCRMHAYEVSWFGPDSSQHGTSVEPSSALIRVGRPPWTKQNVRTWAQQFASLEPGPKGVHGVWEITDARLVERYGLATERPLHLVADSKRKKAAKHPHGHAAFAPQPQPTPHHHHNPWQGQERSQGGAGPSAQLRDMAADEARMKPGSVKHIIFTVLKEAWGEGATAGDIVQRSKELGLKDWTGVPSARNTIVHTCTEDDAFCRIAPGRFALASIPGVVPYYPPGREDRPPPQQHQQHQHQPAGGAGYQHPEADGGGGFAAHRAAGAVPSRIETLEQALVAHDEKIERAQEVATASRQQLQRMAEAAARSAAAIQDARRVAESSREAAPKISRVVLDGDDPCFEPDPELLYYQGDPGDRRAMMEHKRRLDAERKRLRAEKEAYLREKKKRLKVSQQPGGELVRRLTVEHAQLQKSVDLCQTQAAAAEHTLRVLKQKRDEMAQRVEQMVAHEETRQRELEERERQREAERQERERLRLERERELARQRDERERLREEERLRKEREKRYPIDDQQLVAETLAKAVEAGAPPPDLSLRALQPAPGAAEEMDFAAVFEFLVAFGARLGLQVGSKAQLRAALAAGRADRALAATFERLLSVALPIAGSGPRARRWIRSLTSGTWQEVLRQFVLVRAPVLRETAGAAARAAARLRADLVEALPEQQKAALLRWLVDEVLETDAMRHEVDRRVELQAALQRERREDEAAERAQRKAAGGEEDATQEALWQQKQAEHEAAMRRTAYKMQPLGFDRDWNAYWFGVGGLRDKVYVEGYADGSWACLATPAELDARVEELNVKGVREKALRAALLRHRDAIVAGMEAGPEPEPAGPVAYEAYDQAQVSLETLAGTLRHLKGSAATVGAVPEGGWPGWEARLASAADGGGLEGCRALLLELEEALYGISVKPEDGGEAGGEAGGEEEAALAATAAAASAAAAAAAADATTIDALAANPPAPELVPASAWEDEMEIDLEAGSERGRRLWWNTWERATWRGVTQRACTPPRLCYAAATLSDCAKPLIKAILSHRSKTPTARRQPRAPKRKAEDEPLAQTDTNKAQRVDPPPAELEASGAGAAPDAAPGDVAAPPGGLPPGGSAQDMTHAV